MKGCLSLYVAVGLVGVLFRLYNPATLEGKNGTNSGLHGLRSNKILKTKHSD